MGLPPPRWEATSEGILMHEYGLVEDLLEEVTAQANRKKAKKVRRIVVQLGQESGFTQESLETAFEVLRGGTAAEGATLEFKQVPGRDVILLEVELAA